MLVKNLTKLGLVIAVLFALSMMFSVVVELNSINRELSNIDGQLSKLSSIDRKLSDIDGQLSSIDLQLGSLGSIDSELSNIDGQLNDMSRDLYLIKEYGYGIRVK